MNTITYTEAVASNKTVVALRGGEGDVIYAVLWDGDKSLTVWKVEDALTLDAELGLWTQVETCGGTDAPQNFGEAMQVGAAILTAYLDKKTVIFKAV